LAEDENKYGYGFGMKFTIMEFSYGDETWEIGIPSDLARALDPEIAEILERAVIHDIHAL